MDRHGAGISSVDAIQTLRSVSMPQRLLLGALVTYAGVFGLVVAFGRPGLGLGQGFYLPIVLASLATDAATGAIAGGTALGLYLVAEAIAGRDGWSQVVSAPSSIRLVAYVAAGVVAGWFATQARTIVADSLRVLDDLLAFARRDPETGLHARDAFEEAVAARVADASRFALLVLETRGASARTAARALPDATEVSHLGRGRLAALVEATGAEEASGAADRLEHRLAGGATVGWAFHPDDGDGALALFATAGERLQARRGIGSGG